MGGLWHCFTRILSIACNCCYRNMFPSFDPAARPSICIASRLGQGHVDPPWRSMNLWKIPWIFESLKIEHDLTTETIQTLSMVDFLVYGCVLHVLLLFYIHTIHYVYIYSYKYVYIYIYMYTYIHVSPKDFYSSCVSIPLVFQRSAADPGPLTIRFL